MDNQSSYSSARLDSFWDSRIRNEPTGQGRVDTGIIDRLHRVTEDSMLAPKAAFVSRLRLHIDAQAKGMLGMITGFHHIVLFCTDTERSREWYRLAGFEYSRGYGGMHWFHAGPYEIMLHPAEAGPAGNAPHIHLATNDVSVMFERVRQRGLIPLDHQQPGQELDEPVTRPWGDREFELEDPDGHRIVMTQS